MYRKGTVPNVRPGASVEEVIKMHAIARLMLHPWIKNTQVLGEDKNCRWRRLDLPFEEVPAEPT